MKTKILILIILISVFIPINGCNSIFGLQKDLNETQTERELVQGDLTERSRQLTTAVNDIVETKKENQELSPEEEVIGILSLEDQRIEGLPIERINTDELLSRYIENQEEFLRDFDRYKNENTELKQREQNLQIEIDSLTKALEIERNRPWWSKLWRWILGLSVPSLILVVIGVIAAPQFTIPLLTRIIRWVVKTVPSLIGFIGVVGVDIFDATIKGFQNVRETVKKLPDDVKLSKQEVMQILDSKMSEEHDKVSKAGDTVRQRKATLKL